MNSLPPSERIRDLKTLDNGLLYVFVLGPGEGEAIAVALPGREGWILIDGCRSGDKSIGLIHVLEHWRKAEPIRAYALTHPHTDHAKGIVELLELYGDEIDKIAVTRTAATAVASQQTIPTSRSIIAKQVKKGLEAIERLCASKPGLRIDLVEGCRLVQTGSVVVTVHSPRNGTRVADTNEQSAVIEIERGRSRVILGSDLPTKVSDGIGWEALVSARPCIGEHSMLKIPHHGSCTSHHGGLFKRQVSKAAWAATPFNTHGLPDMVSMSGLRWILTRDTPVHLTAPPISKTVQVPVPHPGTLMLSVMRDRISTAPTGNPVLDAGAVEVTPRAINSGDSLWCFALDDTGQVSHRWRGDAAIEVI